MRPKVSVVMATYNRAPLLVQAIRSIQEQTLPDLELVIVDDRSPDDTLAVARRLAQADPRITVLQTPTNVGPGAARNLGIARSQSDLIAIMDDDDLCVPHRLAAQAHYLDSHPECTTVFSTVSWFRGNREVYQIHPGIVARGEFPSEPRDAFRLLYTEGCKIPNQTATLRAEVLRRMPYPTNVRVGEDWLLFLRIAASGLRFGAIPEPLVLVRRDAAVDSLMQHGRQVASDDRQVLREIRVWLRTNGITEFDHLHRLALSNHLALEARRLGGIRGLARCQQAILVCPSNARARKTLRELVARKVRHLVGRA